MVQKVEDKSCTQLVKLAEAGRGISNQTERALFSQMSKGNGKDKLQNNHTCNFDKKKKNFSTSHLLQNNFAILQVSQGVVTFGNRTIIKDNTNLAQDNSSYRTQPHPISNNYNNSV